MSVGEAYPLDRIIAPMKPNSVKKGNQKQSEKLRGLLRDDDYVAERKIDGCHYFMIGNRFFSTSVGVDGNPIEKTDNFPHLKNLFTKLNMPNLILDGEIDLFHIDPRTTSQHVTKITGSSPAVAQAKQRRDGYVEYTCFDILRTPKGTWLTDVPYFKRREILEYFIECVLRPTCKGDDALQYVAVSDMCDGDKEEYLQDILNEGLEGIVLKHKMSTYQMGKKPMWQWMKIKQEDEVDVVIMGYKAPAKEFEGKTEDWPYRDSDGLAVTKFHYYNWIGAIRVGQYQNGELVEVASISGFAEDLRREISQDPEAYIGRVIKMTYMEKTAAGKYRHPSFQEFHADKNPNECLYE